MYILSESGERVELGFVSMPPLAEMVAEPTGALDPLSDTAPVRASRAVFELGSEPPTRARRERRGPPPRRLP